MSSSVGFTRDGGLNELEKLREACSSLTCGGLSAPRCFRTNAITFCNNQIRVFARSIAWAGDNGGGTIIARDTTLLALQYRMNLSPGAVMHTQPSYRQSILLVEDSADSREMLRLLLEDLNYYVWEAKTADEAFKLLLSHPPDLILTDFGLPDVDGIELTRKVRGLVDRRSRLPIVMLTACDRDHYYEAALRAGCSVFLSKPVDFTTLEAVISKLIRNSSKEKYSESTEGK